MSNKKVVIEVNGIKENDDPLTVAFFKAVRAVSNATLELDGEHNSMRFSADFLSFLYLLNQKIFPDSIRQTFDRANNLSVSDDLKYDSQSIWGKLYLYAANHFTMSAGRPVSCYPQTTQDDVDVKLEIQRYDFE